MTTTSKHKIIEVTWLDSGGQEGRIWDFKDEYTWPREKHQTIGYKLKKKDGYLYIAQSLGKYQYGRVFRIPLGCILSIREL